MGYQCRGNYYKTCKECWGPGLILEKGNVSSEKICDGHCKTRLNDQTCVRKARPVSS